MRTLILAIAAAGLTLFLAAFGLSHANPAFVESLAREAIRIEVQRRVAEKVDALDGTRLARLAERLTGRNEAELADAKRRLAEQVPSLVAETVARMRKLDCECRQAIERRMTGLLEGRVATLSALNERLALLIRTRYVETAEQLTREFRIFTAANALIFGLLGAVALARRQARLQLLLPTVVLLGAALSTAAVYLFMQDWLHTILFSDYVGFGYFAYLLAALALLADIAFNRARVSTRAINVAANLVGSAVHAVPC